MFAQNFAAYGVRKVWQQMMRGKKVRTTISDKTAPCPRDHVNRQFFAPAPDRLWVSDFTYIATWAGFIYVAFVIDTYARRTVGWRASRTANASFVLDTLEQALHDRSPTHRGGLIHHSDRGWRNFEVVSTPRSNGSTGSTIVGCWSPPATFRLPKPKINIMLPRGNIDMAA